MYVLGEDTDKSLVSCFLTHSINLYLCPGTAGQNR